MVARVNGRVVSDTVKCGHDCLLGDALTGRFLSEVFEPVAKIIPLLTFCSIGDADREYNANHTEYYAS
jgi:hypothetical protein